MQIIPIASGKGGVGKSLLSANLAVSLGQAGKKVILADLDLGSSNLHLAIGQIAPKIGLGTFLSGASKFEDIITETDYENVRFIAGDSEIPGLTSLKVTQKNQLIKKLQSVDADYLILDLGAGTHLTILDLFLLSPQGIVVTAPTVTATLNGYLFIKNAVFRLMYVSFRKGSPGYKYLEKLKKDSASLQRLYIPKLVEMLREVDPKNTGKFEQRLKEFHPRLIMNMIDDPKDANKSQKIRRSCQQYLDLDIEHLGIMYRDNLQDKALAARLPVVVYKPNAVLSQGIFRIADKILQSETINFTDYEDFAELSDTSFENATEEASEDFASKMAFIQDIVGTGAFSVGELAETIRTQQYEITSLRNENTLLKKKLLSAAEQGFKV